MSDYERHRHEMQIRASKFGATNAGDFTGLATTLFTDLGAVRNNAAGFMAAVESGTGESGQQVEVKDTSREMLRDELSDISRTSKSMEYAIDGIQDKFRFRRNLPDAELLARGRAFYADSLPYNADFLAYGMPTTFRADLLAACDAFEASIEAKFDATAEGIAARANLAAENRTGMRIVRTLDGIVKNRYRNDPGKLAAWAAAIHVEKAPEKEKEEEPEPIPVNP